MVPDAVVATGFQGIVVVHRVHSSFQLVDEVWKKDRGEWYGKEYCDPETAPRTLDDEQKIGKLMPTALPWRRELTAK